MGKSNNAEKKTIAETIASWKAAINDLPEVNRNETLLKLLSSKTPLDFLLGLCEIMGLSYEEILTFFSRILTGAEDWSEEKKENLKDKLDGEEDKAKKARNVDNGILSVLEETIKIILIANFKNMYTCSINPIIPFNLLKSPNGWSPKPGSIGIKIPISTIDLFNVLQQNPKGEFGSALYFDNDYNSNELWKSTDFNCFMWYVINKGSTMDNENLKLVWDNRVKYFAKRRNSDLNKNPFKSNFFNEFKGNGTLININTYEDSNNEYIANEKRNNKEEYINKKKGKTKGNEKVTRYKEKKAFFLLEYNEIDDTTPTLDTLTMFINADRYLFYLGKDKDGSEIYYPKTVFEFNFDYINSLKIFDSKVIVANIYNALIGLVSPAVDAITDIKYNVQMESIASKISDIVKTVMESEDTIIDDNFFTFSNSEYDQLLNDTELKYSENYEFGNTSGTMTQDDINNLTNKILDIGSSTDIVEQETKIKNTFIHVAISGGSEGYNKITGKFTWGGKVILDLIKETITQLVLQIFSPSVMMLFIINKYFMGDITDINFKTLNIKELIKSLRNLILTIAKQILDVIIKQFLKYILDELKEIINTIIRKILLERIEYYMEILRGILSLIKMFYNTFTAAGKNNSSIDNVNYADIVTPENNPV